MIFGTHTKYSVRKQNLFSTFSIYLYVHKIHVKTLVCLEEISHHSYTTTRDIR